MTKEEHAKVLAALNRVSLLSTIPKAIAEDVAEAIAIMRKEQGPPPGELCPACAAAEFERVSGFGKLI